MQRDDFLWVEKYRPSKVSECILPSDLQEPFSEYVEQGKVPNMIFDKAVTAPVLPAETKPILFFDFINSIALRILLSFFDLNIEEGLSSFKIISSQ